MKSISPDLSGHVVKDISSKTRCGKRHTASSHTDLVSKRAKFETNADVNCYPGRPPDRQPVPVGSGSIINQHQFMVTLADFPTLASGDQVDFGCGAGFIPSTARPPD